MFKREIKRNILSSFGQNKIIIIYGPRQVGKTTLCKEIAQEFSGKTKYIDCDILANQQLLSSQSQVELLQIIGDADMVIIDEAQRVPNIGINLNIIIDSNPKAQIIATGSSSFDLANQINEPLTGRTWTFFLYPFSYPEILNNSSSLEQQALMRKLILFGGYPEVFAMGADEAKLKLEQITEQYLYRDIFTWESIKKPALLTKLLQLLSLQLGSEVSLNELANRLETTRATVERYVDLLEKTFIIFRLEPLRRNQRRVIGRHFKIYFYDLGIRNSFARNFNSLEQRTDTGGLWENFCIVERLKYVKYNRLYRNTYFWRSYDGQEIDYVEDYDGNLHSFEFKWSQNKATSQPTAFRKEYPASSFETINPQNIHTFLAPKAN